MTDRRAERPEATADGAAVGATRTPNPTASPDAARLHDVVPTPDAARSPDVAPTPDAAWTPDAALSPNAAPAGRGAKTHAPVREPGPGARATPTRARRPIASEALFAGANELHIEHRGALYRLKQTPLGKLILTK